MEKIVLAWEVKKHVFQNIQMADNKAGFVTALATLGAALFTDLQPNLPMWKVVLMVLASGLLMAAIITSILSVQPRIGRNLQEGIIYFGNIASHDSYADFRKDFEESDALDEVAQQVYALSRIAQKKYAILSWAYRFLFAGLAIFWVSLVLSRLIR